MAKISVIGICGNSVFLHVDHFHEKGETLVADSVYEEVGGKGINQAVAAARMGAQVSFLAAVGNDESCRKCLEACTTNGINAHLKIKPDHATTFAFILTEKEGENQVTEYKGAELTEEDVLEFEAEIASSDILLLQQEVPQKVNDMAVQLAKKHQVKVILNPAPIREISDEMATQVFLVTPNEQERQAIDVKRFQNCITTCGKNGCTLNDHIAIRGIEAKAVDTTGAGDTFNGVLAVCLAEGKDMETACRYAVVASGISVERKYVLNAIPYRMETERKVKEYE